MPEHSGPSPQAAEPPQAAELPEPPRPDGSNAPGPGLAPPDSGGWVNVPEPETFADSVEAAEWMRRQHVTVTEVGLRALTYERADHPSGLLNGAASLAVVLGNYTELAGPWPGWQQLSESLLHLAERAGDRDVQRRARIVLAGVAMRRGDPAEVERLLAPELADATARGDGAGRGRLLAMLGVAHRESGELDRAADRLIEALAAHREAGTLRGYASILVHLADLDGDRGNHRTAARRAAAVLRIEAAMTDRDPILRMSAYEATGDARFALGELPAAIDAYERAHALASRHAGASVLHRIVPRLAESYERTGRPERAAELRRTDGVGARDAGS